MASVGHTSAVEYSVSVRYTSAVMKSEGAEWTEGTEQTSAVTKSLSEGMVGSDESEADGLFAVT